MVQNIPARLWSEPFPLGVAYLNAWQMFWPVSVEKMFGWPWLLCISVLRWERRGRDMCEPGETRGWNGRVRVHQAVHWPSAWPVEDGVVCGSPIESWIPTWTFRLYCSTSPPRARHGRAASDRKCGALLLNTITFPFCLRLIGFLVRCSRSLKKKIHLPLLSACIRWYSLSHIHYGNGMFKMFLKSVGSQMALIQDSDFILDIKWSPKIMESIFTFRLMLIFYLYFFDKPNLICPF